MEENRDLMQEDQKEKEIQGLHIAPKVYLIILIALTLIFNIFAILKYIDGIGVINHYKEVFSQTDNVVDFVVGFALQVIWLYAIYLVFKMKKSGFYIFVAYDIYRSVASILIFYAVGNGFTITFNSLILYLLLKVGKENNSWDRMTS